MRVKLCFSCLLTLENIFISLNYSFAVADLDGDLEGSLESPSGGAFLYQNGPELMGLITGMDYRNGH